MSTAAIARWFMLRRACSPIEAVRRAEAIVIRRSLKPDKPRGTDMDQLRIPFAEFKARR